MRKNYPLRPEGKHPDRVLDAVKHDIRKYMKRERRTPPPEGADFWDFDCRLGLDQDSAEPLHVAELMPRLDALAKAGAASCYVELLAKPGHWQRGAPAGSAAAAGLAPDARLPPTTPTDLTDPIEGEVIPVPQAKNMY